MGHLQIVKTCSLHFIANEIGSTIMTKKFIIEMGEPVIWMPDQYWYIASQDNEFVGFICHNNDTILYTYVRPQYRNKGVFSALYNEIPVQPWKTIASNLSLPIFLNKGFEIVKSFKICHKLTKK